MVKRVNTSSLSSLGMDRQAMPSQGGHGRHHRSLSPLTGLPASGSCRSGRVVASTLHDRLADEASPVCPSKAETDRQAGRRAEEGAAYRMRADQQTCWCACSLTQERGQCWPPISPLSWKADQKGEADDHAQAATPPRDLPT